MVSAIRALGAALCGLLLMPAVLHASETTVSSSEEIFSHMYEESGGSSGSTVEDAIRRFYWEGEEDLGTYPPSDLWERDFELRRRMPPTLDWSGRMDFRYSDDDISGIEKWEKELELFGDFGRWDAMFRFSDINNFASQEDPFRWEKARIRFRDGKWKVTAGSYGTTWGKGLAVNMFESKILDFDNEAEGLKAEYEDGPGRVEVIYGWDKDRKDDPQEFEIGNSNKEILGARGEYKLNKQVSVGASAVNVQFPGYENTVDNPQHLDYDLIGGDVSFREGDFTAYYEYQTLQRGISEWASSIYDFEGTDGTANYLNVGYFGNSYSLVGEYADYQGLDHPFNTLPPLRRWQEAATADPDDFVGYGGLLTWNPFNDGSYFQISYEQDYKRELPEPHDEFGISYFSPNYNGFNWIIAHWQVYEKFVNHDQTKLTLAKQVDDDNSVGMVLEREELHLDGQPTSIDYIAEIDYDFRSKFVASYLYERTGAETSDGKNEWRIWEFKYHPDEDQEWHLSFGDRREGYVCSGGICRLEPAFDGVKAEFLQRF